MDTSYFAQSFGLAGRTALITGGARGIGLAIATALGRAGARVVINDLNAATCAQAVEQLTAQGIAARSAVFDVSQFSAVEQARADLDDAGWAVDILVSNAGNQNRKPLVEMQPEEWQQLMNVHVNGAFNCARNFLPGMISRGFGRVLLTASVASLASAPNISAYSTAKGGVAALMRSIAVEYGAHGITANAIAPGYVRTEFTTDLQNRSDFDERLRQSVPCGRWADTDDIAPAALFLVSPAASFINGQILVIDGGMRAKL